MAGPYLLTDLLMIGINIFLNIDFNTFWAGGNIFLIFNSYYLIVQSFYSLMLVAEVPFWLRHFKPLRFLSLFWALFYNTIYVFALIDFIYMFFMKNKKKADVFEMLESMYFGYNLILHASIVPVNCAIIIKETFLEFF